MIPKASTIKNESKESLAARRLPCWKILIVDDEPDIHRLTRLCLHDVSFSGRGLEFISAASAQEAREILKENPDIAVSLIDVVMETDDAGLKLVDSIRNEFGYLQMRIIIRTGQPGLAPERFVIDHFDIDDYKDKTELTTQKLYTTVRLALKGYRDLEIIEGNRRGLRRILEVTPNLYNLRSDTLEQYFQGVLQQLIGICRLGHSGMVSTIDALAITLDGKEVHIRAGTGEFEHNENGERCHEVTELCTKFALGKLSLERIRKEAIIAPLEIEDEVLGFLYLEAHEELTDADRELIQIMVNQCAAGLENFRLHHNLEESYEEVVEMLGQVAEFKDSATGSHIHRIQEYTRRLARELGATEEEANAYAKASRLHDIGKVGIPDEILRKTGKLSPEEFEIIKRHSCIGDAILKRSSSLVLARVIAKLHHERWDGKGYPEGLAGEAIPYVARIVAAVDVFDALVSTRPYKKAWSANKAADEIAKNIGTHFDPVIGAALLALIKRGALDDLVAAAVKE